MRQPAVWLPIVVLLVAFVVFCFVELSRRPAKYLPKVAWAVLIVAQVPLGGICYLIFGRGEPLTDTPSTPTVPSLPERPAPQTEAAAAPGEVAIRTSGLTKVFRGGVGLHGVDLVVPARGVYGLVGPNGAGKTTLLSLLAGLRRPDSGTMAMPRRVLLCPDTPAFEPWLTATETVEVFRALAPAGGAGTREALALVGLDEARGRRVGGFSRGMTQRLGLAVMLASGAPVLMLDEPTSALDPQGRAEVLDLVRAIGRERAVLFSSHILADVQRVADTVGVLRQGRLIYQGPVADLLERHTRPSWRLQLRSGTDALVARLAGLAWVSAVQRQPDGLRVDTATLRDGETLLPGAVAAAGAELIALNPVGADLETVFLSMVGAAS
jgi:ABC-2 type transport system ATP-binding protein